MIWNILKTFFTKQAKNSAGSESYQQSKKINECYAKIETKYRSQGDVYPATAFSQDDFPVKTIPYWAIINRTCHLYEGNGRQVKLPFLTYAAVYKFSDAINNTSKDNEIKNQVSNIVNGKMEQYVLLPSNSTYYEISEPLVINFNILYTLPIAKCPSASEKCIQLSSPFCEYTFQKLARYFYTVGYDDEKIKSKESIEELVRYVKSKLSNST
jgi:hypothetical protein